MLGKPAQQLARMQIPPEDAGSRDVEQFEMARVAAHFVREVAKFVPGLKMTGDLKAEHAR